MSSPVACYDFRVSSDKDLSVDLIKQSLKKIAKHWVFQEERGDTGYLHYQGRFSLVKKRRKNELLKLWVEMDLFKPIPMYLEPTTNGESVSKSFSYVLKEDTRIAGPWSDKDIETYIPRQYRGLHDRLYPWQQYVFDSAKNFDIRHINIIYDNNGNKGKSTLGHICKLYGNGIIMPPINDAKELIQVLYCICSSGNIRSPSPILIDLPRAMEKSKLYGIFSAIEQIKNGYLYDTRYTYKEWYIDSPQVWVFTNETPDSSLLSFDRWKGWKINCRNELEVFNFYDY